jgi:hypothetical protein
VRRVEMTQSKYLSLADVIRQVHEVVDKVGPHTTYAERYKAVTGFERTETECMNAVDTPTGPRAVCLVGTWAAEVFGVEHVEPFGDVDDVLGRLAGDGLIDGFEGQARDYLEWAQEAQDRGQTWREAERVGLRAVR